MRSIRFVEYFFDSQAKFVHDARIKFKVTNNTLLGGLYPPTVTKPTLIGTETNTPEEEITGGFARVCIHSLKSQLCLKSGTVFAVLELLLSFP